MCGRGSGGRDWDLGSEVGRRRSDRLFSSGANRTETGAVGGSAVVAVVVSGGLADWCLCLCLCLCQPLHARRFSRSRFCTFRRSISRVDCSFASFFLLFLFIYLPRTYGKKPIIYSDFFTYFVP